MVTSLQNIVCIVGKSDFASGNRISRSIFVMFAGVLFQIFWRSIFLNKINFSPIFYGMGQNPDHPWRWRSIKSGNTLLKYISAQHFETRKYKTYKRAQMVLDWCAIKHLTGTKPECFVTASVSGFIWLLFLPAKASFGFMALRDKFWTKWFCQKISDKIINITRIANAVQCHS